MNTLSTREIIEILYKAYLERVDGAKRIRKLLEDSSEEWIEDHFALRSFQYGNFSTKVLEDFFSRLGYETICNDYVFEKKKLKALHMAHPDRSLPKVFISALQVHELLPKSRSIIEKYLKDKTDPVEQMSLENFNSKSFLYPCWGKVEYEDYLSLREESEYGAWTLLFGNSLNHFTIAVHHLKNFQSLASFNEWVKEKGLVLNQDNGEIKGSADVKLKQSSTLAESIEVEFLNGEVHPVPCAFIEFAYRFPLDGKSGNDWEERFQGFVEGNADRIFTSTNSKSLNQE